MPDSLNPAQYGMNGLYHILLVIICIGVSWWTLQVFRFDLFLRNHKGMQAKLLQILLSVMLGYEIARFISDYFEWSQMLKWLV